MQALSSAGDFVIPSSKGGNAPANGIRSVPRSTRIAPACLRDCLRSGWFEPVRASNRIETVVPPSQNI